MIQLLAITHIFLFSRLLFGNASSDWILHYPKGLLVIGIIASVGIIVGRKFTPVFLIGVVIVWLCFSNKAIRNVSHEFLLWVTFASVFNLRESRIKLPPNLYQNGLWLFFGVNYLFSAIEKIKTPQWLHGDALDILMTTHAANLSVFSDILRALPLTGVSYFILALEFAILPLAFITSARKWTWLCLMALHVGIGLTFRMEEISLVMLVTQLALYQKEWFPKLAELPFLRKLA